MVYMDNSQCQIDVKKISFKVKQTMVLDAGLHKHIVNDTLVQDQTSGPAARVKDFKTELVLDLSKIKFDVPHFKKKKGQQKKQTPEDLFMFANVQPATNSKHITNQYSLVIEVEYKGCTCCSNLPDAKTPLTIVPIVNPLCVGF